MDFKKSFFWTSNQSNYYVIYTFVNMYLEFVTNSRSGNGYGFWRPGVKTGVVNDILWSEIAYYSRQSLSRSLNQRRRNGTALEWVGSGKDREGRKGKEKRRRKRCDTWKGGTNNFRLPAAKGFLRELGRNEMRSSYLYSRLKGQARIAYYLQQSLSSSLNKSWRNGTAPRSWTSDTS